MNLIKDGRSASMLNKHSPVYRVIAILLAFALLGVAIFVPIASGKPIDYLVLYIALGVYLAALVATMVVTEIIMAKRKKKKDDEQDS